MADTNPASPAAGTQQPAIDMAAINQAVTTAVAAAIRPLADNQKILADTLAALPPAKPAAQKEEGKPAAAALTADDVKKIVTESLTAHQQSAQTAQQRDEFLAKHLAKVPAAYHGRLGTDPAKWETEAAAIREQLKADLQSIGATAPSISGEVKGGGTSAAAAVDTSKLSGYELIDMAVQQSNVQPPPAPTPAQAATTA